MYDDEDIMNLDDETGPRFSRLGQFVIQSCPGSRSMTPLPQSGSGIARSRSAKSRSSGNDVQVCDQFVYLFVLFYKLIYLFVIG